MISDLSKPASGKDQASFYSTIKPHADGRMDTSTDRFLLESRCVVMGEANNFSKDSFA